MKTRFMFSGSFVLDIPDNVDEESFVDAYVKQLLEQKTIPSEIEFFFEVEDAEPLE